MSNKAIDQMKDDMATFDKLNHILFTNWEDDSAKAFNNQIIEKVYQTCNSYGKMAEEKLAELEKIAKQLEDYAEQLRQNAVRKVLTIHGRAYMDGQNWMSDFSYQTTCDQFVRPYDNAAIVAIVQSEHPDWKEIVVTSSETSSNNLDI